MEAYCEPTSFLWVEESKGQASTPRPRKKVKRKKEYVGWGSRELIAFLESMGKDCAKALSQYDVTNIINLYINDKKLVHPENKRRVVCDEKLFPLFEKKTIFRNKIHDLLESHFAENQEDSDDDNLVSSDENGYSVPKKLKILTTQSKKKAPEVSKSCLAAINSDNIKLLYLRRSLVQELLNNPETFETKVVGSFVRVKSDPHDIFQKNSHQLQLVTGVKEGTPACETKPSMLLQILGMTDVISMSELSDDIFLEEEIEELRSRVKDGLMKQPTIGELEQKVVVLHEDITKHWLAKELVLLKNLIDRANEKGWRHRVREYLDRRKLLQSPDEQSRLLSEIPKVMAEEVKPELVSEPAVHWRQGHKDECRPSVNNSEFSDEEVSFVGDNQLYSDGDVPITVNGGIQYEEQVQTAKEKPGFTPPAYFTPDLSVKDDKNAVHHSSLGDELASQVELHGTSEVSQLHVSSSSDGMCINDSISDTDSIHDLNSDSCDSCSTLDNLETVSRERKLEPIKTLEEESYSRVSSNGNVYASGEPKEEASGKLSGSSGLSINRSDKNLAKPSVATSGFWDGSLDYCRTKYMPSTDAKPSSGELGDFSSDICSKGPKTSTDTHSGISSTGKLVAEPALAEKGSGDPSKNLSTTFVGSREPDARVKTMKNDKDLVKSVEVGTENLKGSALPFCVSEKANDLDRNSKMVLQSPMSKKAGLSPKSIIGPPSGMKEPIAPVIKPVKAAANVAMPSQVARPAPSASAGLKTSVLKVVEQFRAPKTVKQSDDVERKTEKAVFPYESFVKLYHWNKVELRPCGLINCGNSCYANVILQCLAFTPPLTAYLLQGLHSKTCAKKHWCFTCEFERLILKAKEGGSPLSPISILSQIQKIGSHLSNGREEDAHEFLRYAIDTMQSTCLQEAGVNAAGSLHEETTLLGLTFGGYLRSKIKCARCRGKSEKQDRMMDLTVEIGGDIETLEDALRQFTGTEPLDGENKYHCGRCKSYEKAKKKLNILEAPNILTIALKRFQSGKFGKLNKTIRFPEILNLAPYMRGGSDKSPIYRLYGVVVHLDIMNSSFSGHYVCYVRNAQNKWYKIDDSTVLFIKFYLRCIIILQVYYTETLLPCVCWRGVSWKV